MIIHEHASITLLTRAGGTFEISESSIIENSLTTADSCSSGGGIPPGTCNAGTLSVSFRMPPGLLYKDLYMAKLSLYTWYEGKVKSQKGEYNITSAQKIGGVCSVEASDNVVLLDETCYSEEDVQNAESGLIGILGDSGFIPPADIFHQICNAYSIPHLSTPENIAVVPESDGKSTETIGSMSTTVSSECSTESVKDFAISLAEYLGCFIVAYEDGRIGFCRFGHRSIPDVEINKDCIEEGTFQRSPYYIVPSRWRVDFDSGFSNSWYVSSGFPEDAAPLAIEVTNNPFWQAQEDIVPSDIYAGKLTNMVRNPWKYIRDAATDPETGERLFHPFSAVVHVPFHFRVGDLVHVRDPETGELFRTYITDIVWTFRGGQQISFAGADTRTLSVSRARSAAKKGADYSKYLYRKSSKESGSSYVHPTYTEHALGLYNVGVDGLGHVSAVSPVTKSDITALGIPARDTIYTHPSYTSRSSGFYKITIDNGHVSEASSITKSDITSLGIPENDTKYSAGTGLLLSGTTFNHLNSVVQRTSLGFVKISYDKQGHITGASDITKDDIVSLGVPDKNTTYTLTRPKASETDNQGRVHPNALMLSDGENNTYVSLKQDLKNINDSYPTSLKAYLPFINSSDVVEDEPYSRTTILFKPDALYCTWGNYGANFTLHVNGYIDAKTANHSTAGLMSAEDKTKLDGIEVNANNYVHPSYISKPSGFYKITVDNGHVSEVSDVEASDLPEHEHNYLPLSGGTLTGNLNVPQINGNKFSKSGDRFGVIPIIDESGVMEIGKYLDFHLSDEDTSDHALRITASSSGLELTGAKTGKIPTIDIGGTIDIGKNIDFHLSNNYTNDYDLRVTAESTGLTLPGTTKGTFSGNLSGNASSSTKLINPRNINGVPFDGTSDIVTPINSCYSFDNSSSWNSTPWHKVASTTITKSFANSVFSFYVNRFNPIINGFSGILRIAVRSDRTIGKYNQAYMTWDIAGEGIVKENFLLVYTETSSALNAEIWVKHTDQYQGWQFVLLASSSSTSSNTNDLTLYNSTSGEETYTSGTGVIVSSLSKIQNQSN